MVVCILAEHEEVPIIVPASTYANQILPNIVVVRATLHPDAPAALELSIALTEGSWTLTSPHLILS